MAHVLSVNVGTPREVAWDANLGRSAIEKHAVSGPVRATALGLEGDQVADTRHHGGRDQAVYAFAREDLDRWAEVLGRAVPDGQFGENLTTTGIDVNEALLGERWAVGSAVLEVAMVRTPCRDFQGWQRATGYDARAWVRRFTEQARPGPYLRVVQEGELAAGDAIEVVHRPGHDVTVTTMFRALMTDHDLLPRLLEVEEERGRPDVENQRQPERNQRPARLEPDVAVLTVLAVGRAPPAIAPDEEAHQDEHRQRCLGAPASPGQHDVAGLVGNPGRARGQRRNQCQEQNDADHEIPIWLARARSLHRT